MYQALIFDVGGVIVGHEARHGVLRRRLVNHCFDLKIPGSGDGGSGHCGIAPSEPSSDRTGTPKSTATPALEIS